MNANNVIILARKHLGGGTMVSSADLCLADAIALRDKGNFTRAKQRATESLAYSVGIFHPNYQRAIK